MRFGSEKSIGIRDVKPGAEMHEVEELQREVWGVPDLDIVPASQLVAATTAGGVLIGAFNGETMIGFVYGFAGIEHGRPVHHSHMLAVKPEYRNFHLGHRLKLAQRERVQKQGIDLMSWTFDPLQSLNAYINFKKFGVVSNRYFVNFYGEDAPSFLHRNGTDRLWVSWLLSSKRVNERLNGAMPKFDIEKAQPIIELGKNNIPLRGDLSEKSDQPLTIEIPGNIGEIEKNDPELAAEWREATRWAFNEALASGYLVEEFAKKNEGEYQRGIYFLAPGKDLEDII
ncbi:MAG: GNAT family N-acetyltransferase [Acidobacteria bacterium]|nr:GNAT family N-acetyltransferase [Acidobacteriota bacterium]